MERVCFEIYGEVQGVGFRYLAQKCAVQCGITGYVQNEWDGSVRIEAQGTPKQLKAFTDLLWHPQSGVQIDRMDQQKLVCVMDETSFRICY